MHELHATQGALDQVLKIAGQRNARRVVGVHLVVGELSTYEDEPVQFYWDELSKGTLAAGAALHFRRVPAELQCMTCATRYHPEGGEIICPQCGSSGARIWSGEEFYVEAIDVE